VSALLTKPTVSALELMALAIDLRVQAERAASPQERRELDRVADIYTVLATLDSPIELLQQWTL
jgi:hypothetical protein